MTENWFIDGVPNVSGAVLYGDLRFEWTDIVEYTYNEHNDTIEIVTAATHQEDFNMLGSDYLYDITLSFATINSNNGLDGVYHETMIGKYVTSYVTHADNESPVTVKHIFKVLK